MPSVVMNEGVFSFTCRKPLAKPSKPPTATATGTDHRPMAAVVTSLATSMAAITAVTATTPSTDRSIDPIRMTKVMPMQRISGIAALLARRTKLPIEKKLELKSPIRMHSAISTATGAQVRQRASRVLVGAAVTVTLRGFL